jgi:predicted ester cyclase
VATSANVRALEQARERWNAGDLFAYLELYDPGIVLHGYVGVEPGIASVRAFYEGFHAAFPQSELVFDDLIAADDKVVCRFTIRGTHGGPFQGLPPTGKPVVVPGITILRFVNGRCVERWSQADFMGLLTQLGAVPSVS